MELDRTQRRILGALIEKRLSTPDQYPLTFKALMAACNQKSNRDPVLVLEEFEVEGTLLSLREKGLVLYRERDGGYTKRYAEKLSGELGVDDPGAAVLAELLLRGPQTAPELSRRIGRMVGSQGGDVAEEKLAELSRMHLARLLPKESGQRHARWTHLLAPESESPAADPAPVAEPAAEPSRPAPPAAAPTPAPFPATPPAPDPAEEVLEVLESLREELAAVREEVADLRDRVGRLEDAWS